MSKAARTNRTALRAQHREQALRDARDRQTKGPEGSPREPEYRTGSDTATNEDGWADVPGKEVPPRGGPKNGAAGE